MIKLTQLEYTLLKKLIAQKPTTPRDHSKLMVIDRTKHQLTTKYFYDLVDLLDTGDVLVFNQTKVFPARLITKKVTGGKIELLLVEKLNSAQNQWWAMRKGKISFGQTLDFGKFTATVLDEKNNLIKIQFSCRENELFSYMKRYGHTPLPPYIDSTQDEKTLRKTYQTIYAKEEGSAAAPTAGLHFTSKLLTKLKSKGIQIEYLTLHVGLGTFLPVKEQDITKHHMHSEYYFISPETVANLNAAKNQGRRIISVGTTTTRVLETLTNSQGQLNTTQLSGHTDIYIYPPYKFKFIDGLITNFHLPHSTLLALVSALVTYPNAKEKFKDFKSSLVGKAYEEAIKQNFRFFSFGDACLII